MSNPQRNSLGKGLAALLGDHSLTQAQISQQTLPTDSIVPGSMQPRKIFNDSELESLKDSIQRKGILQPIIVRKFNNDTFEIIAGERRWRAAKSINLEQVPVIILNCSKREALEIGLIENLQRHDLNPLEEAEAILRLQEEFQLTQEQIASNIGKSRSHIANMLRLNNLGPKIKDLLRSNKLSAGHARSLITAENPEALAEEIINNNLSVRETERRAKSNSSKAKDNKIEEFLSSADADTSALALQLSDNLHMKVDLKVGASGGVLTIKFKSLEQLDLLISKLQ